MPPGHGPASAETIATRTYAQVTRNNLPIPNYQQPSSTRHQPSSWLSKQHTRGTENGNNGFQNVRKRGCFNCGEENNSVSTCKFYEKLKCHTCHKMGHKSKFCYSNTY